MEFVKSRLSRNQLKKSFLAIFKDERSCLEEKNDFCKYDLLRVTIFTNAVRPKLTFDAFEYLLDYILPLVRTRTTYCFSHLSYYDCYRFFPLDFDSLDYKTLSLVHFYQKFNFNLYEPFRILEIHECTTKFGLSYTIKFCCGSGGVYKTWLPKSAYSTIANCLHRVPLYFDFYTNNIYFRVVDFDEYRGKKYAVLTIGLSPETLFRYLTY